MIRMSKLFDAVSICNTRGLLTKERPCRMKNEETHAAQRSVLQQQTINLYKKRTIYEIVYGSLSDDKSFYFRR